MDSDDLVYAAIQDARPALQAQDYMRACDVIRQHIAKAQTTGSPEEVAALFSTLGSYLTMASLPEEALAAYESAETLLPNEQAYTVMKLRHMYQRMGRRDGVIEALVHISTTGDEIARHSALALLGVIARDNGEDAVAVERLGQATAIAEQGDVPSLLWDTTLAEAVARIDAAASVRFYERLQRRAESDGDSRSAERAVQRIMELGSGPPRA